MCLLGCQHQRRPQKRTDTGRPSYGENHAKKNGGEKTHIVSVHGPPAAPEQVQPEDAKEVQAAMADNRPLVKKLAIYAENVKEIDLHNVKIEGYEGERLHFANVGHFEED